MLPYTPHYLSNNPSPKYAEKLAIFQHFFAQKKSPTQAPFLYLNVITGPLPEMVYDKTDCETG
ncbi:MAG: hypothetical protein H6Q74_117 [Firmicutes bacterium]|nr:hypothetical protein [Bacillota bacterium]